MVTHLKDDSDDDGATRMTYQCVFFALDRSLYSSTSREQVIGACPVTTDCIVAR